LVKSTRTRDRWIEANPRQGRYLVWVCKPFVEGKNPSSIAWKPMVVASESIDDWCKVVYFTAPIIKN
jgi:hypothetical protein